MKDTQWNNLIKVVNGETPASVPVGFIIDCPWLPGWYGVNILDYITNDELWLKANLKAMETFPDVTFLPGFWSEYGMCTEPSAFGAKCTFWKNEFPFADKIIYSSEDLDKVKDPNPETDGLLPFMLNRLLLAQPKIEDAGYKFRFSVSRGPLNIASFLMGTSELMMAMMMEPENVHKLLRIITNFLKSWHEIQHNTFSTIEGIMMLDDIVGFVGEEEFKEFGLPYLKELYNTNDKIKLFHNDADCSMSVKYYPEIGINLYNPGTHMTVNDLKSATDNKITILGNIPPRDVLASGTPETVSKEVKDLLTGLKQRDRFILSCGGGMPPNVSTENIQSLIDTARNI
ncbi:MAG: uroporphyrinogen decarboxylase family protein [Bacteroidales bacterium]|nr:uroporphyrinogen decarboxylase family protein [Bacteroidales bacterium]